MKRLKIAYVDHLPPLPEDLPPETVHVCIGASGNKVELIILRNGFIAADPAMHKIERRIQQLEHAAAPRRARSVAESIGLYPNVSTEWRNFFDDLLQREDSWAFLVPVVPANTQN